MSYCKREWLNSEISPSTESITAYDGIIKTSDEEYRSTFLQINDCHEKINLYKADYDTIDDFIRKMKILRTTIDNFINYLEQNK